MDGPRLRLTGIGEGLNTTVMTVLSGADSPQKVMQAVHSFFPEASVESMPEEPSFGSAVDELWSFEGLSMQSFLAALHEQRILDTALDFMSRNIVEEHTEFTISRQAAIVEKISFPIPGKEPVGGVITVRLQGSGLREWLEAATWHNGRAQVPRTINDERSMLNDGEASTWH